MLRDGQLAQLCTTLGLSKEAQAIIAQVRASPPSRLVRGGAGNVCVRYPSQKMGVTIQAESHRNELAGVYEHEHDPATLEYYDQPPPIKLVYQARNGQQVGILHTPDYFVIRTDAVGWEEWKPEDELARLADRMPHRYLRATDGRWRCPPGEQYAAPFAFFYRVRSSAEIDWVVQRNLLFLEDYLRADCPAVSDQAARAILTVVSQTPGIRLDELLGQLVGARSDDVYMLLATERLTVDVRGAPLAEPERVRVFRDAETARAYATVAQRAPWSPERSQHSVSATRGASVSWDGQVWTLVNPGRTTTTLQADDGTLAELSNADLTALLARGQLTGVVTPVGPSAEARELLQRASPEDFREANRRYALLAPRLGLRPLGTAPLEDPTPERTLRSWLAKWRAAERLHQCGYVGLLSHVSRSGNRLPKLPEATRLLLDTFIAQDYETLKQKHKLEVYGALVRACDEHGLVAPSYTTFVRAVQRRPRQEQLGRSSLLGPVNTGLSAFWQHGTMALNGTRRMAGDLVRLLQTLTQCADLGALTMLPWAEVLACRGLLRRQRSWCPACYDAWRQAGHVIYEPLLWTLQPVAACPHHRCRLQERCPHPDCQRALPLLGQRSRPGYCSACAGWLGVSAEQGPADEDVLTDAAWRTQAWVGQALGELLASAPHPANWPTRAQLTGAITAAIEAVAGGSSSAFARQLGLSLETVAQWRRGRSIPSLPLLLHTCQRLGTTPLRLLTQDAIRTLGTDARPPMELSRPVHLPRQPRRAFDIAATRAVLETVLASQEQPPPAMRQVAKRLGRSHPELIHHLPALCHAISMRYLAYQRAKGKEKQRRLGAEIRDAVFRLHEQGCYPSAYRIAPLISQPGYVRDPAARAARQDALRELGWQP